MIAAVTESYPSLDLFEILLQSVKHVTETACAQSLALLQLCTKQSNVSQQYIKIDTHCGRFEKQHETTQDSTLCCYCSNTQ